MVPTLTWGFLRSNFSLDMSSLPASNFFRQKNQNRQEHPAQHKNGARNQNRTDDLILTMDALYRLSYAGLESSKQIGAGDGNRTHVVSLEGWSSTIELHPRNSKLT